VMHLAVWHRSGWTICLKCSRWSAEGAHVRVVSLRQIKRSTHYTLFELLLTQIGALPVISWRTLN
jgi:hypothetical protein